MMKRSAPSWKVLAPYQVLSLARSITILGLFLFCVSAANAATSTWTGGGTTTNWSDANNWSPAGVPPAGDDVTLPPLGSDYTVNLDVDVTVGTLTVGGNGTTDHKVTLKQNSHFCIYQKLLTNSSGTVSMAGGGTTELKTSATDNGQFVAEAGSTIKMDSGSTGITVTPGGTLTFSGEGYSYVNGGTLNNWGTVNMAGGTYPLYVYGSGGFVFNNDGMFNWTGNACFHPNPMTPTMLPTVNNKADGKILVDCGINQNSFHCVLNNQGDLHIKSGGIDCRGGGGLFGTVEFDKDSLLELVDGLYNGGFLNGFGAIITAKMIIDKDADLRITQLMQAPPIVQSGGTISLENSTLTTPSFTQNGGSFGGIGIVTGNFNNSSPQGVSPGHSPGVIVINGNYTQNPNGTLNMQLAGTAIGTYYNTQYDQLLVSGAATLNGPLNVSLLNGFVPQIGNSFRIMTYKSHTGSFSTRTGLTLAGGNSLVPIFGANDLVLLTTGPHGIAGRVTDSSGAGVAGVTITRGGAGTPLTATTDANGFYAFSGLVPGTYDLSAKKPGLILAPALLTITVTGTSNVTNANFSATLPRFTLSGNITKGTATAPGTGPIPNVPVFLVDATNANALAAVAVNPALLATNSTLIKRATTSAAGAYSFSVTPGTYLVAPVLPGVFFTQSYRTVPVTTGAVTAINFMGAGNDLLPPIVTVTSATATSTGGTISDGAAGAGAFTVVATLQNAAHDYLNFAVPATAAVPPQFTATPLVGSYKLVTVPNVGKVQTQNWSLLLPAVLPAGTYALTVRGIDRAFQVTAPITRTITKVAAHAVASGVALSTATASASTASVTLRFGGALDPAEASTAASYRVTVNGHLVPVQSAGYNVLNHSVTLGLSEGGLAAGDTVVVSWSNLTDAYAGLLNGHSAAFIAH